ncbi:MAG: hypothetical protein L3J52_00570 [Proteobacteria bacterium]|nr:hypothetical protein [Pseudomonadota bacterium]
MDNAASRLNSDSPESLIYGNEFLQLTVLGGIKLEGLDRMRVTLKIELKDTSVPAVRHNLDLYNDNQLEKLIRKVAERLEIGTSVITASLSELTEQLEAYRLEQIKNKAPELPQSPKLTAAQIKEATEFLETPNLLEKTNELIGQSGMIGEVDNRLLMFLIFTSRKREQPLHIVSLGASGTGKTHLQEKVSELIPEEDKIEITVLSENAFYYFGQRELKNKLILIEDLDGAESSLYPLRELQSKKRISKTIAHKNSRGETRTIHLVVEGPVSVSGCTTHEQIYEDNSNRSFLIYLDESKEQDKRIMEYQRAVSAGRIDSEAENQSKELMKNAQRLLEPIKVINPYAEYLDLPQAVFKPRRTNSHYLQFIEAVTFYHQWQRHKHVDKETGEIYIETTLEDIENANKLLGEILLRKSDELTGACRNYLNLLKTTDLAKSKDFGNLECSKTLRIPLSTIKRYHYQLEEQGFLEANKQKKTKGYRYQFTQLSKEDNRSKAIDKVLKAALDKAKKAKR